jgi:hypothetical protein
MIQITDKIWAVEVPEDATNIEICNYGENDTLEYMHHIDGIAAYAMDDLAPGTWRFLFNTKTATEEQAKKVVGWIEIAGKMGYYDYLNPEPYRYIESWEESLRSFLFDKGIDPDKNNYAIIENISNE